MTLNFKQLNPTIHSMAKWSRQLDTGFQGKLTGKGSTHDSTDQYFFHRKNTKYLLSQVSTCINKTLNNKLNCVNKNLNNKLNCTNKTLNNKINSANKINCSNKPNCANINKTTH